MSNQAYLCHPEWIEQSVDPVTVRWRKFMNSLSMYIVLPGKGEIAGILLSHMRKKRNGRTMKEYLAQLSDVEIQQEIDWLIGIMDFVEDELVRNDKGMSHLCEQYVPFQSQNM